MIDWLQTLGVAGNGPAVMLVPQASYHLDELVPLRDQLHQRGICAELVVPVPPRKPLNRFRPGVRRHSELLSACVDPVSLPQSVDSVVGRASALVVMNDWGVTRSMVEMVKNRGKPTFAWVEGAQDFADIDTGRERRPYRSVDHVFCLGRHDELQLIGVERTVVGSQRFRALWSQPPSEPPAGGRVTINSNFTYGVFPEARRAWVSDTVGACRSTGVAWDLSRHVAERGISFPYRTSHADVTELLGWSSHLISRFSTLGYEALVRGVQLLYHNPHGEEVATFAPLDGAITVTRTRHQLTEALRAAPIEPASVRRSAESFLSQHLRLEPGVEPSELACAVIAHAVTPGLV